MIVWRIRITAPVAADGWLILGPDLVAVGIFDDAGTPLGDHVEYHTTASGTDPAIGVLPQPDWVAGLSNA